jgi:hypothetical protein
MKLQLGGGSRKIHEFLLSIYRRSLATSPFFLFASLLMSFRELER